MLRYNRQGIHVGRRDFIKTTTMASVAATLPGNTLLSQDTGLYPNPTLTGRKNMFSV